MDKGKLLDVVIFGLHIHDKQAELAALLRLLHHGPQSNAELQPILNERDVDQKRFARACTKSKQTMEKKKKKKE